MLNVAEVLRHRQPGQRHAHTHARRFVHLPKDQRRLGNDAAFHHLVPQVVALAAALANAGEDGIAAMFGRDVGNQLLNQNRFADASAAEQADFAALGIRLQQVNDLDAGFQNAHDRALLGKGRRLAVDAPFFGGCRKRLAAVNRVAQDVEHAPQGRVTDGNADAASSCLHRHAARKPFAGRQHDAADSMFIHVLRHFHGAHFVFHLDAQCFANLRQLSLLKLTVHHRAGHLHDFAIAQHDCTFFLFCAFAPEDTSVISCVIDA